MPISVDIDVAIMPGKTIDAGENEPNSARYAIMLTVISWTEDMLITRNIQIESDAVLECPFNKDRLFIASSPDGVAAQPSPNMFAVTFVHICLIAGCVLGISGNNIDITGMRSFVMLSIRPECSAILVNPHHKDIIPQVANEIVTASFAEFSIELVKFSEFPDNKEKNMPEIIIIPQIMFIFSLQFICFMYNMKRKLILLT